MVDGDDVTVVQADTIREMDRVVQRVLDELHAAERRVLDALTGTARKRPATRLLRGRLDRLERAGAHVVVAVHDGNVPMLRRTLTRFDALTRATCTVQLDVYRSAVTAAPRPRPPGPRGLRAAASRPEDSVSPDGAPTWESVVSRTK
ncbi:MAG TPA: hypothetical protein VH912_12105 [Streptosporangiaceae bacterium]|jgi:hypothetical protein